MQTIKYINREDNQVLNELVAGEGVLKWLYFKSLGKIALHLLFKRKFISAIAGQFMNSRFSARQIPGFIEEHEIDMAQFEMPESGKYQTFNQFFYRKLKPGARNIANGLVSPADGKILVFPTIDLVRKFFVKGLEFTIESFLCDQSLAQRYQGGSMAIIRLAPADYHRFHFPAEGNVSESVVVKGDYFSVSPFALGKSLEIFCRNQREYSIINTKEYGDIIYAEVGATMVGSIVQTYKPESTINKGDEKGYFAFGGSTIVLLFEKGKIRFDADLLENTKKGFETSVLMGEQLAQ